MSASRPIPLRHAAVWLLGATWSPLVLPAQDPATDDATRPVPAIVEEVLVALPHQWPEAAGRFRRSVDRRRHAALLATLEEGPDTRPGLQLALALVPECAPAPEAAAFLHDWLVAKRPRGREAALALGRTGVVSMVEPLSEFATDPERPWPERTGIVAAVCRLGQGPEHADLVRAALLAGTPFLDTTERERFRIPSPQRQVLERIEILTALGHDPRVDQGVVDAIDPDAPWPTLAERVDRLHQHLLARLPNENQHDATEDETHSSDR